MPTPSRPKALVRPIGDDDLDDVIACLQRGFPERPRDYWRIGLDRMGRRPAIEDYPRYGNVLVVDGKIAGVLLLIFSARESASGSRILCNLSSWCVDPQHRSFALLLHTQSVKRAEVVYMNISPAVHTRKVIEALGFSRFSQGQIFTAPLLSRARRKARIFAFSANAPEAALLPEAERQILSEHAAIGCRALICVSEGRAYPFAFQPRNVLRNLISCPQLIYCRDVSEFVAFAHAIGRYLLFRSGPLCVLDAIDDMPGLVGRFFTGRFPKYFKGPARPNLGDLAYTELVLLGP
jgi:hypothetical protein